MNTAEMAHQLINMMEHQEIRLDVIDGDTIRLPKEIVAQLPRRVMVCCGRNPFMHLSKPLILIYSPNNPIADRWRNNESITSIFWKECITAIDKDMYIAIPKSVSAGDIGDRVFLIWDEVKNVVYLRPKLWGWSN